MLDHAGWPENGDPVHPFFPRPARKIEPTTMSVYGGAIEDAGLVGERTRRATVRAIASVLARTEMSRVVDDPDGSINMEARNKRAYFPKDPIVIDADTNPYITVQVEPPFQDVVNLVCLLYTSPSPRDS